MKNSVKLFKLALAASITSALLPLSVSAQKFDRAELLQRLQVQDPRQQFKKEIFENLAIDSKKIDLRTLSNRVLDLNRQQRDLLQSLGGVDSGGGTFVSNRGHQGLLDLYVNSPQLFYGTRARGETLPVTPAFTAIGIEKLDKTKSVAWRNAFAKLEQWHQSSPRTYKVVRMALENLPLYYSRVDIGRHDPHYVLPQNYRPEVLQTMALYLKNIGVFVSKKRFESFDLINQSATIVHESLRHVQITYNMGLSDADVQLLTAAIMEGPGRWNSLDQAPLMPVKIRLQKRKSLMRKFVSIHTLTKYVRWQFVGPTSMRTFEAFSVQTCHSDIANSLNGNNYFEVSRAMSEFSQKSFETVIQLADAKLIPFQELQE